MALKPTSDALHAARRRIPDDLPAARALLQPQRAETICALFDTAVTAIAAGGALPLDRSGDPHLIAHLDGLRWVQRHCSDAAIHVGLPTDVLLRALAVAPEQGLTLECGVYFGRSLRLIAQRTQGAVHGFDSFRGLPAAWNANEGAGAYSIAGRLPTNVQLHAGWFEDTLQRFFADHPGPIRLLHIDCDLHSSTRTVLDAATERLVPGSVLVFDDLIGYPGYEQHELRALEEFTKSTRISWTLIGASLLGREVGIRITSR